MKYFISLLIIASLVLYACNDSDKKVSQLQKTENYNTPEVAGDAEVIYDVDAYYELDDDPAFDAYRCLTSVFDKTNYDHYQHQKISRREIDNLLSISCYYDYVKRITDSLTYKEDAIKAFKVVDKVIHDKKLYDEPTTRSELDGILNSYPDYSTFISNWREEEERTDNLRNGIDEYSDEETY